MHNDGFLWLMLSTATLYGQKKSVFELENTMFTAATVNPMSTIITAGPYTRNKQSST